MHYNMYLPSCVLPYFALPYLTVPCLTLSYLTLPYLTLPYLSCVCVYVCIYLVVTYIKRDMVVLSHLQIYYYPVCF